MKIFLLGLVVGLSLTAGAQLWTDVRSIGTTTQEGANTIRIDSNGDILVHGYCSGPITVDGVVLNHSGGFVAKFTSAHDLIWIVPAGTNDTLTVINRRTSGSLEINSTGEVFLAGNIGVSSVVGDSVVSGTGVDNGYIASLDANGDLQWIRILHGQMTCNDITLDPSGNILIAVRMDETTDFGGQTLSPFGGANSGGDAVVAKYDPLGNLLWVKQSGGTGFYSDRAFSVTSDPLSNVILGGMFRSDADFDGLTLVATAPFQSYYNGFIAKYDSSGSVQWVKYAGQNAICLTSDASGFIYVGGNTGPDNGFDSLPVPPETRMYIARISSAGSYDWVRSVVGSDYSETMDLAVVDGDVAASGYYKNYTEFGPFALNGSAATPRLFATALDSLGTWLWAVDAGGAVGTATWGAGIHGRNGCELYVAGSFLSLNTVTFGQAYTCVGGNDMFFAGLDPCIATEIAENSTLEPRLYPVPSSGMLFIKGAGPSSNIDVLDVHGKLVLQKQLNSGIDIQSLPQGVYYVRVDGAALGWVIKE